MILHNNRNETYTETRQILYNYNMIVTRISHMNMNRRQRENERLQPVQRLTLIFRSRRQIHWIWLIDPHPSSYLVLWDIISKTLFTYLEYEHICKIGDIGKAWMSPCQKLHIFLDSINVDVNEFEIYRPYLQIEYDVLKDTDGFHIF